LTPVHKADNGEREKVETEGELRYRRKKTAVDDSN